MSGHTPGPWRMEKGGAGYTVWANLGDTGSMCVALCGHAESFDKANSQLIAAATTAPHECDSDCPGEQNRRKLEAFGMITEALSDMLSGWRYIREVHGDLSGVGWDRVQRQSESALLAAREAGQK